MDNAYHTHIIRIGNSQGIRIPKKLLKGLGEKVIIRPSKKGLLIQSEEKTTIPPIEEWDALFAKCNTYLEEDFKDWDITLEDGIE
jgi:antitoxin component of MazEF toxin-antitoxin module